MITDFILLLTMIVVYYRLKIIIIKCGHNYAEEKK